MSFCENKHCIIWKTHCCNDQFIQREENCAFKWKLFLVSCCYSTHRFFMNWQNLNQIEKNTSLIYFEPPVAYLILLNFPIPTMPQGTKERWDKYFRICVEFSHSSAIFFNSWHLFAIFYFILHFNFFLVHSECSILHFTFSFLHFQFKILSSKHKLYKKENANLMIVVFNVFNVDLWKS